MNERKNTENTVGHGEQHPVHYFAQRPIMFILGLCPLRTTSAFCPVFSIT